MKAYNEKKAAILYDYLDQSRMFHGTVEKKDRSLMNVPFVTGDQELDARFVKEAEAARNGQSKRTPDRGRHARKYLQCHAHRGSRGIDQVYEEI